MNIEHTHRGDGNHQNALAINDDGLLLTNPKPNLSPSIIASNVIPQTPTKVLIKEFAQNPIKKLGEISKEWARACKMKPLEDFMASLEDNVLTSKNRDGTYNCEFPFNHPNDNVDAARLIQLLTDHPDYRSSDTCISHIAFSICSNNRPGLIPVMGDLGLFNNVSPGKKNHLLRVAQAHLCTNEEILRSFIHAGLRYKPVSEYDLAHNPFETGYSAIVYRRFVDEITHPATVETVELD